MDMDMDMAALCCCAFAAVAVAVYVYVYHALWVAPERLRAALRAQGVAGPRPSFPDGNRSHIRQAFAAAAEAERSTTTTLLLQAQSSIVHDYRHALFPHYERWRKEYGPAFSYSIGSMVFLHASRSDVVRDLGLCVSPLDLGKSSYMKVTHRPLFGDGILKSSGEAWAHQRRLIAPEFFPDKVKSMLPLMVVSANALVASWEDRINISRTSDDLELKIDDDLRAYSADVISRTCFGSSYVKGKRIFAVIRELQKTVSKPNILAEMTGLSFLPTSTNREAWRLNRAVRDLVLDVVRESSRGDDDDDRNDDNLLNAMLRSAMASSAGDLVAAEEFVVDNCKNIYFAGYETTAVTAAWCLMLLALHPDWQDRVRDEARLACAGATAPDFASLHKMKKLTMVIQETLRLYPAGAVVSRQALRDVTLGGVRVPAGVSIYVPVSTVHLDTELWGDDAAEFDPGRFAADHHRHQPHAYLPFGAGARTCLGQAFAMAELKVLLALVLSRFRVALSPAYVHSPALRLIVEPEHGVRLVLKNVVDQVEPSPVAC